MVRSDGSNRLMARRTNYDSGQRGEAVAQFVWFVALVAGSIAFAVSHEYWSAFALAVPVIWHVAKYALTSRNPIGRAPDGTDQQQLTVVLRSGQKVPRDVFAETTSRLLQFEEPGLLNWPAFHELVLKARYPEHTLDSKVSARLIAEFIGSEGSIDPVTAQIIRAVTVGPDTNPSLSLDEIHRLLS